jgi:hypothetical protein
VKRVLGFLNWPMDEHGEPRFLQWWPKNPWVKLIFDNAFWVGGFGLISLACFLSGRDEFTAKNVALGQVNAISNLLVNAESEREDFKKESSHNRELADTNAARASLLSDELVWITATNKSLLEQNRSLQALNASNIVNSQIVQASGTNVNLKNNADNSPYFISGGIHGGNNQLGSGNTQVNIIGRPVPTVVDWDITPPLSQQLKDGTYKTTVEVYVENSLNGGESLICRTTRGHKIISATMIPSNVTAFGIGSAPITTAYFVEVITDSKVVKSDFVFTVAGENPK